MGDKKRLKGAFGARGAGDRLPGPRLRRHDAEVRRQRLRVAFRASGFPVGHIGVVLKSRVPFWVPNKITSAL